MPELCSARVKSDVFRGRASLRASRMGQWRLGRSLALPNDSILTARGITHWESGIRTRESGIGSAPFPGSFTFARDENHESVAMARIPASSMTTNSTPSVIEPLRSNHSAILIEPGPARPCGRVRREDIGTDQVTEDSQYK